MAMTEKDFDKFTLVLQRCYNLGVQFRDSESLIVEAPTGSKHPKRGKWFLVHDNGGEFVVREINSDEYHPHIPYTSFRMTVTAGTAAVRVAKAIAGEPIDWNEQYLTEEETDLVLAPVLGGVRVSYASL